MDDLEASDEFEPPKRGRGRPPKGVKLARRPRRGVARTTTTTTRQEAIDPDDDGDDSPDEEVSPIFGDEEADGIVKIRVQRIEPPEGVLGYQDGKTLTEREILERWGGSVYTVQGISSMGRIVKSRQVRIAGDPIFQGTMAAMKWNKEKERLAPSPPAVAGPGGMSVTELMAMMKEQQATERQAEVERREREKENDRVFAERMREANAESERRRRLDDEERELRRRRDDEERDRKRLQAQEESDRRQQAFMQQTVAMLQASNQQALEFVRTTAAARPAEGGTLIDSIKTVLAIKEAFGGDGGGGDEPTDPMSLIARHGGEWLNGIGNAVAGGIRELKGKDAAPPLAPALGAPRQLQPQQQAPAPDGGGLALPPSLAPKVAELAMKIAAQGGNPEVELGNIVDFLNAKLDGKQVKPPTVAGLNIGPAPQQPSTTSGVVPAATDPSVAVAAATPDRLHGAVVMRFEKRPRPGERPPQGTTPVNERTSTIGPAA